MLHPHHVRFPTDHSINFGDFFAIYFPYLWENSQRTNFSATRLNFPTLNIGASSNELNQMLRITDH